MDPKACWERMQERLENGDVRTAQSAAGELNEWLEKGGFVPEVRLGGKPYVCTREVIMYILDFVLGL